ncbi:hypothetical protein SSX86_000304 [Deinandra increscens subsp. villosa]|uniref:Pentapeptide repeat-containing protein n=1 Tax=Deinandra increscens subsp. villosa TaxID=3103831 RepID=A0AAP0DSW9_9ASTR
MQELSYMNFSNARLTNVLFSGADLQHAIFWRVVAKSTSFYKAVMFYCYFREANLHGACLAGASLQFSNFEGKSACLMDCSFRGAYLQSAILVKSNLTNANLEGANLETANLTNANL